MQLFYREYGTGDDTLIILHGLFGMSDNWVGIAKRLAASKRVIIPDLRNHGLSPHSPEFSIELMMKDLDELYDKLEIEEACILGHSMGGRLAMNYALDHPERVSKLIVADMSLREGRIREEHKAILDAIRLIDLASMKTLSEIEASLTDYIFNKRRVQFVLKNVKRGSQGFHWKLNPIALMDNISSIMPELISSSTYDGVSLFIRGGASDYVLKEDEAAIFKHFPKTIIETIEGASHWLHADNPQEFTRLVEEFV